MEAKTAWFSAAKISGQQSCAVGAAIRVARYVDGNAATIGPKSMTANPADSKFERGAFGGFPVTPNRIEIAR
jgi:hypothetical protein